MLASELPNRKPLTTRKMWGVLTGFSFLLLLSGLLGLSIGSVPIPFSDVLKVMFGLDVVDGTIRTILLDIRLPRILLAITVGAGLSIAGVAFQALLRNPLAEPYILGISSGGSLGAIVAITFFSGMGLFITPLASIIGSGLVMLLVYLVAHRRGQLDTNVLLLAGVMIGAFFNAALLILVSLFNRELRTGLLWLMGNLGGAQFSQLTIVAPIVLLGSLYLFWNGKNYNLISTGDESAMQLGVDVLRIKRLSYLVASLITGVVVSVSGVIGFVGLIIPHICRMVFGPDHRLLLPTSLLAGASFLILADIASRVLIAPSEIPIGAVTAAIGAPLFVYLLRKT